LRIRMTSVPVGLAYSGRPRAGQPARRAMTDDRHRYQVRFRHAILTVIGWLQSTFHPSHFFGRCFSWGMTGFEAGSHRAGQRQNAGTALRWIGANFAASAPPSGTVDGWHEPGPESGCRAVRFELRIRAGRCFLRPLRDDARRSASAAALWR
jgi:hypothetical protein